MWILLRIGFALFVTLARFFRPRRATLETSLGHEWRIRYVVRREEQQSENKKAEITGTHFGLPCAHPSFLRITLESSSDRLFKTLGFSQEIQSGDAEFDRTFYITSDHPALASLFKTDGAARAAINGLFESGVRKIYSDGRYLWAYHLGKEHPEETALEHLDTFRTALDAIPAERWAGTSDPYFWRALAVESLAWGVAAYGVASLIEGFSREHPLYLDWTPLIWIGIGIAASAALASVLLIRFLLGKSSRGHRILVESAIVLTLGLPLAGVGLASDYNRYLDRSPVETLRSVITGKEKVITRSRRWTEIDYFVDLDLYGNARARATLTPRMKVDLIAFRQAEPGKVLQIDLRHGALGVAWIESIFVQPPLAPAAK